jgi:hypothetical protein
VLITLEYTALQSFTYRQQVIQQLDDTISAERAFSVCDPVADQWCALHNPEQTSTPMVIRFKTVRHDFPANVDVLRMQHVLLYAVCTAGRIFELRGPQLMFTMQGDTIPVGGAAGDSIEGIISTRRSNAEN